jgi:hypothetical protein
MTNARIKSERRSEPPSKDLELMVHVLQQAIAVIDDCDPDRNPARCMRQLRRLFDNPNLRVAITRVAAGLTSKPE